MGKPGTFYKELIKGINHRRKKIFKNEYAKVGIDWFYLKYLKHLPSNGIHSHQLFGHKTFFYGGMEYLHGIHEIFIEEVYLQRLPENANILDCGAHIGLSVIYLNRICPTANIIAFEPDAKNFTLLQKNISSHQLKNIDLRNEAIWIENTSLNFIQEGNMGSKIGENSLANTVAVKAARLKDYLNQKVDFLKLDIEGAEYKVLKDVADNLGKVNNMFVEYHGTFEQNNELLEIFEIISKAGFKFYIKEAVSVYNQPFLPKKSSGEYDVQLNIFCFKKLK